MLKSRKTRFLCLATAAFILSGCATILDPDFIKKSDPVEVEKGSMEPYVECIRDKKREETDAPCLLK